MTEAEARAALDALDGLGGLEHWIASQPWEAAPGGWAVPKLFHGWAFRLEPIPGGGRVTASTSGGEPAGWVVPAC
jgi:hypothetical protein